MQADATEKVDHTGSNAQIDTVLFHCHRFSGGRNIGGHALFTARIDRGEQFFPLNAVEGAGLFHIQSGKPQITAVVQGRPDNLLKPLVGEKFLPLQLWRGRNSSHSPGFFVCRSGWPVRRDRSFRLGVFRGRGVPAQKKHYPDQ